MKFSRTRVIPFLALVAILAVIGFFSSRAREREREKELHQVFGFFRSVVEVIEGHAKRGTVPTEFEALFTPCSAPGEYDAYAARNSDELTKQQLVRALQIHEECKFGIFEKKEFSRKNLLQNIVSMAKTKDALSYPDAKESAVVITKLWHDIYLLEREQNLAFLGLIEIQGLYWETELRKKNGMITSLERDAIFLELNSKARGLIESINRHEATILLRKNDEQDSWKNFEEKYLEKTS